MSRLKGVKPDKIQKRLKALFYGSAGAGKTTAAINFPKPYLIDTEKGAENDQYIEILESNGGAIFQTSDFNEVINEIKILLTEKHPYKTLIIDPLTVVWNDLLDFNENKFGSEFGRHYNITNKEMKKLMQLLLRLDMNVIITSHSKNEYGKDMSLIGQTFDCYKKLDFLFDLVFEIQKRGKERIGVVKKTRIKDFKDGEQFTFSYESIAEKYGKEILEKDASFEKLATEEQIKEIHGLIDLLKIPHEIYEKWLQKANADSFHEMDFDQISKCIIYLKNQIKDACNG